MRRAILAALWLSLAASPARAQSDPAVGNWRGTLTSAGGASTPIIVTLTKTADGYGGTTTGVGESAETPLAKVSVTGNTVVLDGTAGSKLGAVSLTATLTLAGNALSGQGAVAVGNQSLPVTFALQRRARQDVVQHQVAQRVEYFLGRWQFEYLGGEFPPLSAGDRSGTVTFTQPAGSSFVTGTVAGGTGGAPIAETVTVGVNAETKAVAYHERRANGVELLSLGNWSSPLAIVFQTAPLPSGGRTYQLRRVISILSESAFDVTEEFAVDGGAFRRLGVAHYTKAK